MSPTCLTWPADRFYWAVLDAPGYRRAGPLPAGLLLELQHQVPIDVAELHAVALPHPVSAGRLIVCAAARSELAGIDPSVTRLTPLNRPDSPELAAIDAAALAGLNCLSGEFEPRPIRQARARRRIELIAALLIVAFLVSLGLHRRTAALNNDAARTQARLAQILAMSRPGDPISGPQPGIDRLGAEIRHLAQVQHATKRVKAPSDASAPLASLLRSWPVDVPEAPHSIQSLTANGASMSVSFIVNGDPLLVLRELTAPPGWRLEEPRISTVSEVARVLLELRRPGDPKGGAP